MNDKQLETFLCIARCGSFSQAEERLFCSKQALLKRINTLEGELGFPLFVRNERGVQLTLAGQEFYRGAESILALEREILIKCRKKAGKDQVLRIRQADTRMLMERVTMKYAELYPEIKIEKIINVGKSEYEQVLKGTIDVGESFRPEELNPDQVKYVKLMSLPYRCLMSASHRLAGRERLSFRQLRECEVELAPRQFKTEYRLALKELLPSVHYEQNLSSHPEQIYELLTRNMIVLTPSYYIRYLQDTVSAVLEGDWSREYGLIAAANAPEHVQRYLFLAKEIYSSEDFSDF